MSDGDILVASGVRPKSSVEVLYEMILELQKRVSAIEERMNDFNLRNNKFYDEMEVWCRGISERIVQIEQIIEQD